nr:hypothetical protein [uncultured Arsenicibacter sp.]
MRNFTNRHLSFAETTGLTEMPGGKFIAERISDIQIHQSIQKEERPLRCRFRLELTGVEDGINVYRSIMIGVDPIPEGEDKLIVSRQYADAARQFCLNTSRLRVVSGAIYAQGYSLPVACSSLTVPEQCLYYDMPEVFVGTSADIYEIRSNNSLLT